MIKGFRVLGRELPEGPEGRPQASLEAMGKPVPRVRLGSEEDLDGAGGVIGNLKCPKGWPLLDWRRATQAAPKFSTLLRKLQPVAAEPLPGMFALIVMRFSPSDLIGESLLSEVNGGGGARSELSTSAFS